MGQTLGVISAIALQASGDLRTRPRRSIGPFIPQVVLEEMHDDELEITDQPVEQGARITDHAYKRPAKLTIKCGWSNSPSRAGFIDGIVGAFTSTVTGVESILSGSDVDQINDLYRNLLELQEKREPFTVYTGKRIYDNMLVKGLSTTSDKETANSLMVTCELRQIIVVTTSTVIVSAPASAQADPGTTEAPTNMGTKQLLTASSFNEVAGEEVLGTSAQVQQ